MFTVSRWLTVGTATRVLARAALLGLDGFYQQLQKDYNRFVIYFKMFTSVVNLRDLSFEGCVICGGWPARICC